MGSGHLQPTQKLLGGRGKAKLNSRIDQIAQRALCGDSEMARLATRPEEKLRWMDLMIDDGNDPEYSSGRVSKREIVVAQEMNDFRLGEGLAMPGHAVKTFC